MTAESKAAGEDSRGSARRAALRRSMAQNIAANLRTGILTGEVPAGARLNQVKLAEDLHVSTTPVREALRLLEAQGLVHIDTYTGATVPIPSIDDLASIYRIRLALCPLVAQSAVLRATEEQLERARAANRELAAARDNAGWLEANQTLHAALDEAIADRRLAQLWRGLSAVSGIYVNLSLPYRTAARRGAHDEHARLIEVYEQGDEVSIEQALVDHLTHTYEGCQEAMRALGEQGPVADQEEPGKDGHAGSRLVAVGENEGEPT